MSRARTCSGSLGRGVAGPVFGPVFGQVLDGPDGVDAAPDDDGGLDDAGADVHDEAGAGVAEADPGAHGGGERGLQGPDGAACGRADGAGRAAELDPARGGGHREQDLPQGEAGAGLQQDEPGEAGAGPDVGDHAVLDGAGGGRPDVPAGGLEAAGRRWRDGR
ncbi:hypothetical protein LUX32_04515 [Actinomadura madurae]|nr:hypothetical protein [Actinomadura madurae]MCP9977007.1 hypothetical protein [Actinomadura madurae]